MEATWTGSVLLAGVVLKLSLLLAVLLLLPCMAGSTPLAVCGFLSAALAAILVHSVPDLKKIGAFLSILHMNGSYVVLSESSESSNCVLEVL